MKGDGVNPTLEQYASAFNNARVKDYPAINSYEESLGYAIDKEWLDNTARVLNCPVKLNAPNWQHGRIIYTTLRHYLNGKHLGPERGTSFLDIGTAKGFSACVIAKALVDSGNAGFHVDTVDIIDPADRTRRNTVAELDGLLSLNETMEEFVPDGSLITCHGGGSVPLLERMSRNRYHVPFAFIDGKHSEVAVRTESSIISRMQKAGDIILFDDCQIPAVRAGSMSILGSYDREFIEAGDRIYAVARKAS